MKKFKSRILLTEHGSRLQNPLNLARFYYFKIFPNLSKILHIDFDVTVQGDISQLWDSVDLTDTSKTTGNVIAAARSIINTWDEPQFFFFLLNLN